MVEHSPREFIDKFDYPFLAGEYGMERSTELVRMYRIFSPKAIAQGLPPEAEAERERWVLGLLSSNWNFLAWRDGQVIGHSALLPDLDRKDAEYIVFVVPNYQNRGIGTTLTRLALETAKDRGVLTVWLTVDCINFSAIKLYRKAGFQFCDEGERERFMILRL